MQELVQRLDSYNNNNKPTYFSRSPFVILFKITIYFEKIFNLSIEEDNKCLSLIHWFPKFYIDSSESSFAVGAVEYFI